MRDGIPVRNMESLGEQRTEAGLIIMSDDGKVGGIHPRWGEVIAIGKDQEDVTVGQYVLVAHGRWSRGFELNGETACTVDPQDVPFMMMNLKAFTKQQVDIRHMNTRAKLV